MKVHQIFIMVISSIFFVGCASGTTIHTNPPNAKILIEDSITGVTPYYYWDRNPSFEKLKFVLKKDGYKEKQCEIEKNVLYVHRFFAPPILALPWLHGYREVYTFELDKINE